MSRIFTRLQLQKPFLRGYWLIIGELRPAGIFAGKLEHGATLCSVVLDSAVSYLKMILDRLEREPEFLCTRAVSRILNISPPALRMRRMRGSGPPFVQLPGSRPIYSRTELVAWAQLAKGYTAPDTQD